MVKYLFLLFPVIFNSVSAQIQIPNGGFEMWEPILNYEEPVDWNTNNDSLHYRIGKDTIAIEGEYSLKFISAEAGSWQGCESKATLRAEFNSPIPSGSSLVFYLKIIPLDPIADTSVYFWLIVRTRDSNSWVNTYSWYNYSPFEEFTKVEIPITDDNIITLDFLIYGGASTNPTDGPCLGRSFSWIDGMNIESSTAVEPQPVLERPNVSIYPNPTSGLINVTYPGGQIMGYELYSMLGELISAGEIEHGQLSIQERGIYVIKLIPSPGNRNVYCKKVIVE